MSSPGDAPPAESGRARLLQSPFVQWLLLSFLWIALALLSAAQHAVWREIPWDIAFGFSMLDWGPWIVLSPIVLWFARRAQIDGRNWRRTVPLHVIAAAIIAVASPFIAQLAVDYRLIPMPEAGFFPRGGERREGDRRPPPDGFPPPPGARRQPPPDSPGLPRFIRARFSIPIYCVLVAAAHAIAYHRRSLERERRALAAEARLTEARLMALQTQINPHFLFNTLNTISSLVYTQPQSADEMICALSELFRRVLAHAEHREIALAKELEFVDRYLEIQRIRFADRLDVRREIEPGLEQASVPTLILQPLIENAILHGIAPRSARGVVTIKAWSDQEILSLAVSDTGNAEAPSAPMAPIIERVGLTNTRARLEALYGPGAHLVLSRAPEGGICARLTLPLRRVASA